MISDSVRRASALGEKPISSQKGVFASAISRLSLLNTVTRIAGSLELCTATLGSTVSKLRNDTSPNRGVSSSPAMASTCAQPSS